VIWERYKLPSGSRTK